MATERISARLLTVLLVGLLGLAAGCGEDNACDDGVDNDGDGLIDSMDPGCIVNQNAEFPEPAACSDGVDNDADGLVDTGDPGCDSPDDDSEENEPIAKCNDGIDNDGDGLIDFPNDPGCSLLLDDDEGDDCPDGEGCPACGDGIDNDGDHSYYAYLVVDEVDDYFASVKAAGAEILKDVRSEPWGMREFNATDLNVCAGRLQPACPLTATSSTPPVPT